MTVARDIGPTRPTPSPLFTPSPPPPPDGLPHKLHTLPTADARYISAPLALKSVLSHRARTSFPTLTSIKDEIAWWLWYQHNHLTSDLNFALSSYYSTSSCNTYSPVVAPWVYGDIKAKKEKAVDAILWSLEALQRVRSEPRKDKKWQEGEEQNCLRLLENAHMAWDSVESEVVGLLVWRRNWIQTLNRVEAEKVERHPHSPPNRVVETEESSEMRRQWENDALEEGNEQTPLTPEDEEMHDVSLICARRGADHEYGDIDSDHAPPTNAPTADSTSAAEIVLNKTSCARIPRAEDVTQPPSPLTPTSDPSSSELSDLASSSSLSDIVMSSPTAEIRRRQGSEIPEMSQRNTINASALPQDDSLTSLSDLSSLPSPNNRANAISGTRRKATSPLQGKRRVKKVKWARVVEQTITTPDTIVPRGASRDVDAPVRPCRVLNPTRNPDIAHPTNSDTANHAVLDRFTAPQAPAAADSVRTTEHRRRDAETNGRTKSAPFLTPRASASVCPGSRRCTHKPPHRSRDTPHRNLRTLTAHNYDEITRRRRRRSDTSAGATAAKSTAEVRSTHDPPESPEMPASPPPRRSAHCAPQAATATPDSSPLSYTTAQETRSPMTTRTGAATLRRIGEADGASVADAGSVDDDSPGRRLRAGEWTSRVAERARGRRLRSRSLGAEGSDAAGAEAADSEESSEEEISFVGM